MNGEPHYDMRWFDKDAHIGQDVWLKELLVGNEEDFNECDQDHTALPVCAEGQIGLIDIDVAPMVYQMYRAGIEVILACHDLKDVIDDSDGRTVLVKFGHIDDMRLLLTLIARENTENDSFYVRMTGDVPGGGHRTSSWSWYLMPTVLARNPILEPVLLFPFSDVEEVTALLQAATL